jgi:aminoglycoside phosphotransferase
VTAISDHPGPRAGSPAQLGAGGSDWLPVTAGESGAAVYRSADATRYAKCVPAADVADLKAERDRVAWLSGQGVPGPRVLDWQCGDAGACLVTSAVPGVPADQVPAEDLRVAWKRIADAVYADLALLLANARETWVDEERARAADVAFAERYGIALDHDRLRFYLHLDPLTWG